MDVVRSLEGCPGTVEGAAVTIGAFDGVHLGHQALLQLVRDQASARGLETALVTFDRHPAQVVRPESAPKLLTTLDQKLELLASTGLVDHTLVLTFDETRRAEPAEEFVREVLVDCLHARLVVVGADFHFGNQRRGNVGLLAAMGSECGFEVVGIPLVEARSGPGARGVPENTGARGVPENTGARGVPENTGARGVPENTGARGVPENTGARGVPENTGARGVPENTGARGVPENTGARGVPENTGARGVPEKTVYSSTAIRQLLAEGNVEAAAELLGRPHEVRGPVIEGDRRGRQLGFPTANVAVPEEICLPADGIYAGTFQGDDGADRPTAISLGRRPTFYAGGGHRLLEAHLLDFDGDLYGQTAAVRFVARIRDEERFDSATALVDAIHRDVDAVRAALG